MMRCLAATLAVSLLVSLSAAHVQAASFVESLIRAAKPCAPLKTRIGFVKLGVDRFESAKITTLSLHVNDKSLAFDANGTLACKTSDNAAIRGNIWAQIAINTSLELSTCRVQSLSVTIVKAGGNFGSIVESLKSPIEQGLRLRMVKELEKFCHR